MYPESTTRTSSSSPEDTSIQDTKQTFARVTAKEYKPERTHGIIIEALPSIKTDEYLEALSTIINPTKIRYFSRIANARICAFLSCKSDVDQITNNHRTITIKNLTTPIRPLIRKQTKIIISNVCPIIPNRLILEALTKYEVTPSTNIINMKIPSSDQRFAHILSFRRTFLIEPDQTHKIPESLLIFYDETNFRIFLNADNDNCFLCKKNGHFAKNCILTSNKKDNTIQTTTPTADTVNLTVNKQLSQATNYDKLTNKETKENQTINLSPTQTKDQITTENHTQSSTSLDQINLQQTDHPNTLVKKKRASDSLSNSNSDNEDNLEAPKLDQPHKKNPPKKNKQIKLIETPGPISSKTNPQPKEETKTTGQLSEQKTSTPNPKPTTSLPPDYYENTIESLRGLIEHKLGSKDLKFDQQKQLLLKCFAYADPASICKEFNTSLDECYNIAHNIYCETKERYLKARLKRLMKKVDKLAEIEEESVKAHLMNMNETSDYET